MPDTITRESAAAAAKKLLAEFYREMGEDAPPPINDQAMGEALAKLIPESRPDADAGGADVGDSGEGAQAGGVKADDGSGSDLVEAFDESKVKRDAKGEFAKQASKGAGADSSKSKDSADSTSGDKADKADKPQEDDEAKTKTKLDPVRIGSELARLARGMSQVVKFVYQKLKRFGQMINNRLSRRYGKKAAKAILLSGQLISWSSWVGSPMVGMPGAFIPAEVAYVPSLLFAEMLKQIDVLKGDESIPKLGPDFKGKLTAARIKRLGERTYRDVCSRWADLCQRHGLAPSNDALESLLESLMESVEFDESKVRRDKKGEFAPKGGGGGGTSAKSDESSDSERDGRRGKHGGESGKHGGGRHGGESDPKRPPYPSADELTDAISLDLPEIAKDKKTWDKVKRFVGLAYVHLFNAAWEVSTKLSEWAGPTALADAGRLIDTKMIPDHIESATGLTADVLVKVVSRLLFHGAHYAIKTLKARSNKSAAPHISEEDRKKHAEKILDTLKEGWFDIAKNVISTLESEAERENDGDDGDGGRNLFEKKDSSGHEHKGKGPGGGQFVAGGGGGGSDSDDSDDKPRDSESDSHAGGRTGSHGERHHGDGDGTEDNPIHCGSDIKQAAKLLAQGKYIQLDQPDEVSTLLDRMDRMIQKAIALGEDAPNFDLCKISVPKTNLFCQQNIDIPRVQMPQMRGLPIPGTYAATLKASKKSGKVDLSRQFIEHLKEQGIKVKETKIRASHLRASQNQIVGARVVQLLREANAGDRDLREKPIFVTRDNYIVDGHHHWAADIGFNFQHDKDLKIPVYQLDMDIGEALAKANAFTKQAGLAPKSGGNRQESEQDASDDASDDNASDDDETLTDDPDESAVGDTPDAHAETLAEILYGVLGDKALEALKSNDVRESLLESWLGDPYRDVFESWDASAHPRGKGGRFVKKGSGEAVATAKKAVGDALSGKTTGPEAAKAILQHANLLTVKQLTDIHKQFGKPIPGKLREQLIAAVVDRAGGGEHHKAADRLKEVPNAQNLHAAAKAFQGRDPNDFYRAVAHAFKGQQTKEQMDEHLTALKRKDLGALHADPGDGPDLEPLKLPGARDVAVPQDNIVTDSRGRRYRLITTTNGEEKRVPVDDADEQRPHSDWRERSRQAVEKGRREHPLPDGGRDAEGRFQKYRKTHENSLSPEALDAEKALIAEPNAWNLHAVAVAFHDHGHSFNDFVDAINAAYSKPFGGQNSTTAAWKHFEAQKNGEEAPPEMKRMHQMVVALGKKDLHDLFDDPGENPIVKATEAAKGAAKSAAWGREGPLDFSMLGDEGAESTDSSPAPEKPKAAVEPAAEPVAKPETATKPDAREKKIEKEAASLPPGVNAKTPDNPAYVKLGRNTVADPKFRQDFAESMSHLYNFVEFQDKLVEIPRVYKEMKKRYPGLTVDQFHAALDEMRKDRKVELHVLNEERLAKNPQLAINRDDRMYYYVRAKDNSDELSGDAFKLGRKVNESLDLLETKDAAGHEHKGKGKGGGQFVAKAEGGESDDEEDEDDEEDNDEGNAEGDEEDEETAEWDGTINQNEVSYAGREHIAAWNFRDDEGNNFEQDVYLAEGSYDWDPEGNVGGNTIVPVYRWESHQEGSGATDHGDWTTDLRRARRDGERFAEENNQEESGDDAAYHRMRQRTPSHNSGEDVDDEKAAIDEFVEKMPEPQKQHIVLGPEQLPKSKANVVISSSLSDNEEALADELIHKIFGGGDVAESYDTLSSSLGMPDDAQIIVSSVGKYEGIYSDDLPMDAVGVRVQVKHPKMDRVSRFVGVDSEGKRFIRNEILEIKPEYQGEGLGAEIFSKQVESAAENGIEYIATHAAGNARSRSSTMNGYYTWPRFGYDMSLTDTDGVQNARRAIQDFYQEARDVFPRAKSVLDIFKTKKGRDWWKKNGRDMLNARFDLKEGSRSLKVLAAYAQERAAKAAKSKESKST